MGSTIPYMSAILQLKENLKHEYSVIKNSSKPLIDRKKALLTAEKIAKAIITDDPKSNVTLPSKGKYAWLLDEFVPNRTKNVVWDEMEITNDEILRALHTFNDITSVAYKLTKYQHPTLDDQSSTFGQIVNAKTGHLVALTIRMMDEKKKEE